MKDKRIWVTPAEGLRIPITTEPRKYLPEDGQEVTYSMYWERLKRSGAVTITDPKAPKNTTSPSEVEDDASLSAVSVKAAKTTKTQGD